jgi:hypothetical protein
LLTGASVALALTVVGPAFAQSPMSPSPAPQVPAGATMGAPPDHAMAGVSQCYAKRHTSRQAAHKTGGRRKGTQANDNVADQLNREELSRAPGSALAPGAMPPPGAPMR